MNYNNSYTKYLLFPLTLILTIGCLFAACSKQTETDPDAQTDSTGIIEEKPFVSNPNSYDGWLTHRYENIEIIYSPENPFAESVDQMAKGYIAAISRNILFLGLDSFPDIITVYFYSSVQQGLEITGQGAPFATANEIHFWQRNYYGPTLMALMLHKWLDHDPQYLFLKNGITTILDYSGVNYHALAKGHIGDTTMINLRQLGKRSASEKWLTYDQSAMVASFVDFVAYTYGRNSLKQLYQSTGDFDFNIEQIFGISPDSLQSQWIEFLKVAVTDSVKP